ncbi:MAG: outer membrane protein [Candidatus Kryptonium sp.]
MDRGLRDFSTEINGWFGASAEFRHKIIEGYLAGLSLEVVNKRVNDFLTRKISNQLIKIPVEDRYTIYIAELNLFFLAPFSSEKWNIYIGGGIGAYKGNFTKSIADAKSEIQKSPINFGIQVMSGVGYNLLKNLGIKAELKFRDPIVEVESKFKDTSISYDGYIIQIDPSPFRTRINFDTITFILGIVYSF